MKRSAAVQLVQSWTDEVFVLSGNVRLEGTLDTAAELAAHWFAEYLPAQGWHP